MFFKNDNFEEEKNQQTKKIIQVLVGMGILYFYNAAVLLIFPRNLIIYILDPKNYRNRPYANFTFAKSNFLVHVPILHTV